MKKRILCVLLTLIMLVSLVPATALTASAAGMSTSENMIKIIKDLEGFKENAYADGSQWSIGYGTVSEEGATITMEAADLALRKELAQVEETLNAFAEVRNLSFLQREFDALVSFSYNCGTGWMTTNGRFRQAVLEGKKGNDFLNAISLWANAGTKPSSGLLNRRMAEANIYLNGSYSSVKPGNYTYVIYDANGGDAGEDKMQGFDSNTSNVKITSEPTRKGYEFRGWYTARTGGTQVKVLSKDVAGKTLYAHWNPVVTVTNDYINIRDKAGAEATHKILGQVYSGETFEVLEIVETVGGKLWGKIQKDKITGWIALMYTNYKPVEVPEEEEKEETPETSTEKVIATGIVSSTTNLNIRNVPSTSGAKKGSLAAGTSVSIYEILDKKGVKWGRIDLGWICLTYVNMSDSSSSETVNGKPIAVGTVVNCAASVNIRAAAGTHNAIVGKAALGSSVNIYEITEKNKVDWGRTEKGWICMQYIKLNVDEESDQITGTPDPKAEYSALTSLRNLNATVQEEAVIYDDSGAKTTTTVKKGSSFTAVSLGKFSNGKDLKANTVVAQTSMGFIEVNKLALSAPSATYYTRRAMTVGGKDLKDGQALTITDVYVNGTTVSAWVEECEAQIDAAELLTSAGQNKYSVTQDITALVMNAYGNLKESETQIPMNTVVFIEEFKEIKEEKYGIAPYVLNGVKVYIPASLLKSEETGSMAGNGNAIIPGGPVADSGTNSSATGIVKAKTLSVRTGPGLAYTKVATLSMGATVTVHEQQLKDGMIWGRIGDNRWVCMSYVTLTSTGSSGDEHTGIMGTIARCFYAVNVRSAPGTGNALVGQILVGSRVEILEQKTYSAQVWGRVTQGWICMDYVLLDSELPDGTLENNGTVNNGTTNNDNTTTGTGGSVNTGTTEVNPTATLINATVSNSSDTFTLVYDEIGGEKMEDTLLNGFEVAVTSFEISGGKIYAKIAQGWIDANNLELNGYAIAGKLAVDIKDASGNKVASLAAGQSIKVVGAVARGGKVYLQTKDGGYIKMDDITVSLTESVPVVDNSATNGATITPGTTVTPDNSTGTPVVTPSTGIHSYTGKVIGTNALQVRGTPSLNGVKGATLKNGQGVMIYETTIADYLAWGRCDAGWICLVYVDLVPYTSGAMDARVVQAANAAIYSEAGSGDVVGTYAKCTVVDIYEFSGSWARTAQGWVSIYDLLA